MAALAAGPHLRFLVPGDLGQPVCPISKHTGCTARCMHTCHALAKHAVHTSAHIAGCALLEINLTRGYGLAEFRDDLKKLYRLVRGLTG